MCVLQDHELQIKHTHRVPAHKYRQTVWHLITVWSDGKNIKHTPPHTLWLPHTDCNKALFIHCLQSESPLRSNCKHTEWVNTQPSLSSVSIYHLNTVFTPQWINLKTLFTCETDVCLHSLYIMWLKQDWCPVREETGGTGSSWTFHIYKWLCHLRHFKAYGGSQSKK